MWQHTAQGRGLVTWEERRTGKEPALRDATPICAGGNVRPTVRAPGQGSSDSLPSAHFCFVAFFFTYTHKTCDIFYMHMTKNR